jgi:hypothetical protein
MKRSLSHTLIARIQSMQLIVYLLAFGALQVLPFNNMFNFLVVGCTLILLHQSRVLEDSRPRRRRASFATRRTPRFIHFLNQFPKILSFNLK